MPSSQGSGTKLFVGGLSFETTDEKLRAYFQTFGSVSTAVVKRDSVLRRSRGFGFVTFLSHHSAEKALAQADHRIDGRRVEAKYAVPRDAMAASGDGGSSSSRGNSSRRGSRRPARGSSSGHNTNLSSGSSSPRGNASQNSSRSPGSGEGSGDAKSSSSSSSTAKSSNHTAIPEGGAWSTVGASKRAVTASTSSGTARNRSRNNSGGGGLRSASASSDNIGTAASKPPRRAGQSSSGPSVSGSRTGKSGSSSKSSNSSVGGSRKIFVGGLHYDTTDATLKKSVPHQCFHVQLCTVRSQSVCMPDIS